MNSHVPPPYQSSYPLQSWWKLIWSLHLPPKVRIFLWKASRDFIPTSLNLKLHHVPSSGICPLCKINVATTSHTLVFCKVIRKTWKNTMFWRYLCILKMVSFVECGLTLAQILKKEDFELFAAMVWAIWYEICKATHSSSTLPTNLQIEWVFSMMEAFRNARIMCESEKPAVMVGQKQNWKPPLPGNLRLDVDAGYDDLKHNFSVGAVVRNSLGCVIGAKACRIRNPGSVKGAELTAIRLGMEFCLNHGLVNICIFSDSLQAVQAANNTSEDLGPEGTIAEEVQDLLRSPGFIYLKHMGRMENEVAHILAKKALTLDSTLEVVNGDLPSWLVFSVTQDYSI